MWDGSAGLGDMVTLCSWPRAGCGAVAATDENLTAKPDSALVEYPHIPDHSPSAPADASRGGFCCKLGALFAAVIIVYLDRDGYRDVKDDPLTFPGLPLLRHGLAFHDRLQDITLHTETARLVNVLVIHPCGWRS